MAVTSPPPGGWRRRRSPRRHRLACLLSMALGAPPALGAAFAPGTPADPPTGDVGAAATAEEPLAGDGIRWEIAPWRTSGALTLDLRSLREGGGVRSNEALQLGDLDFASHVWQPWFVQLRAGVGWIASTTSGNGTNLGSGQPERQRGLSLTGRGAVLVFPQSRFPFELRADVTDSRTNGLNLGTDYRVRRVALAQSWRDVSGMQGLQLNIDHSAIDADDGRGDRLWLASASATQRLEAHRFEFGLGASDHRLQGSGERTRLANASGRHSYQPSTALQVETIATWNEARIGNSTLDLGSDVRQVSSLATWRMAPGTLPGRGAPLLAGTARWVDARALGAGGARAQALNATVGLSQELDEAWRVALSGSANQLQGTSAEGRSASLGGTLGWAPPGRGVGAAAWRYTPSASLSLTAAEDSQSGPRRTAGLQLTHGLARSFAPAAGSTLSLTLTQGGAALHDSQQRETVRSLAHGFGLAWQHLNESGAQSLATLSLNDARSWGRTSGRFELVNLQLSQRFALGRYSSWNANLTAQATRNESSELDAFSGARRTTAQGWQPFYAGSLSYEDQRAFGVPRLRLSLLASATSQVLERRAAGDIDAPRERVSQSFEARLDYSIGRLDTRLAARVARLDDRTVAALQARAQRRF